MKNMNSNEALPSDKLQAKRPAFPARARLFYTGAAALLLILMFLGFQQFYLHGKAFPDRPLTPPIRTLLISHGVAMSLWMLLLLVQPLLVVNQKYRVHITLGKIGAVLAACIFILGFKLGIEATRVTPPEVRLWNLPYKQFMAVPIISVTVFAGFVTAGIVNRRRPEIHRPMMLLATLAVIPAALDRIDAITSLYRDTVWGTLFGPFFSSLVIGAVFLVVKWALTRSFDRFYAAGWAGLVVVSAGIMKLATTQAWDGIASSLLRY
ncbi:MAG TPA: hypothetical protein PKY50_20055 [Candidatus Competibacter sp.]|nr:hypothetical protein [Candidatus Competibacter sp.]